MKDVVKSLVDSKISDLNMFVSDAFISKVEGKNVFNIVLDSDTIIDLNRITDASRIINEIMDKTDLIEHNYDELDIYSEEKGESINE